jgi:hypothetical protein
VTTATPPHELILEISGPETLRAALENIASRHYLASMSGGKATWIGEASGCPLAVIAQQWSKPKYLSDPDHPLTDYLTVDANPHLQFKYRCQIEPEPFFAAAKLVLLPEGNRRLFVRSKPVLVSFGGIRWHSRLRSTHSDTRPFAASHSRSSTKRSLTRSSSTPSFIARKTR